MKFTEILSISGQPGLYCYVARSTHGVIVESLIDHKRMNATGSARVSALSEIAVFTEGEDLPLGKVFEKMYAHTGGKQALDAKSAPEKIKEFIATVLPDYDRDRVHFSDMKKMVAWYNLLVGAGIDNFSTEDEPATEETSEEKAAE